MTSKVLGLSHVLSRRIRWRGFIVAGIATILMNPAYAEPRELGLDDAIRLTLDLNPALKQYPLRYEMLSARKQSASLRPALQIAAEIENVGGSGSYNGTDSAESTLSLFSVLERGDKRAARAEEIDQQISTVALQRQQAVTNLAADVALQFIQVAAAQEAVTIKQADLTLQQRIEREVSKRVDAGAAPDAELLRVQAASALRKSELTTAKSQLTIERNKLSSFWLEEKQNAYRVNAKLYQLPQPPSAASLDELAESNPEVALLAQRIRAQDSVAKRIDADSAADIGWRFGMRNFSETDDTAFSLGFELPLFAGSRNRGALTESQLEKQRLQLQRTEAVWLFKRRLQELHQRLISSNAETQTLVDSVVPLQERALKETQRAYNRGRYSFAELAAEQGRLNDLKQRTLEGAARSHRINIELERLLGQTMPNSHASGE
jgi:cobalt-zinc-cadmium efflux system outer membrane protein